MKKVMRADTAQAAFQMALDALEEIPYPLQFSEAERILKPLAREVVVSPEAFTRKVLDEARKWTEGVLDGFWEALGISSPPVEVTKALKEHDRVRLWCPWGRKAPLGAVSLFISSKSGDRYLRKDLDLPSPTRACPRTFVLWAHPGRVELNIAPRFFARRERVLFHTRDHGGIRKTLDEVAPFRPLLEAMGLLNLEEALEDLAGLKSGEVRLKGPYLLVRKGRLRALKRRTYFDDPALEAAFLVGERVLLAYENGVQVTLKGRLSGALLYLEEASIRWGHEVAQLQAANWVFTDALSEFAPAHLLRGLLSRNVKNGPGPFSGMKGLIAELATHEDPLEALEDKDLLRRMWLDHLARF